MAKGTSFEDKLAELKRLKRESVSPQGLQALRKALDSRVNILVAKAAEVASQWQEQSLVDALEAAFDRFMVNPVKSDKGCQAKIAVADALYRIGASSSRLYMQGIRHVQMEPAYGGAIDTAAGLRGLCALGLVHMNHPAAMNEVARLLADPQVDARIMAVRAIACSGDTGGEPLLRYKVHCGQDEPQIIAECFLAILQLSPGSLCFVAEYLESSCSDMVAAAADALGQWRNVRALEPLGKTYACSRDSEIRRVVLLAIAELHCERAIEFLLGELRTADGRAAEELIWALSVFKHDRDVCEKVAQIVESSGDAKLATAMGESFDTTSTA